MMAGLLRAEWLKLRRMSITWILLTVPSVLALLGAILPVNALADAVRRFGQSVLTGLESFAFPQPVLVGLQLVDFLGSVLVVIFITAVVGNEFGFDTWKNLLTRRAARGRLLATKLLYALAGAAALVVIVPSVFQLGVVLAFKSALGIDVPFDSTPGEVQSLAEAALLSWLRLAVCASIGLLAATVTRSSGGGIAISLPWLLADGMVNGLGLIGGLWQDLAPYTFNFNLGSLASYLDGRTGQVTLAHSLVALWIYTVGFVALAIAVFRRRDIAG